jgi:hypothetical protein
MALPDQTAGRRMERTNGSRKRGVIMAFLDRGQAEQGQRELEDCNTRPAVEERFYFPIGCVSPPKEWDTGLLKAEVSGRVRTGRWPRENLGMTLLLCQSAGSFGKVDSIAQTISVERLTSILLCEIAGLPNCQQRSETVDWGRRVPKKMRGKPQPL